MLAQQAALFDLEELARAERLAVPWRGAPLAYTTDYHDPQELDAAWDRWIDENGRQDAYARSHMWHSGCWNQPPTQAQGHECHLYSADTSCTQAHHGHGTDPLPAAGHTQAICPPCRWHYITNGENAAVEAWHDHAMPGWRNLPLFPLRTLGAAHDRKSRAWGEAHYPANWQFPGAPILTRRPPMGTRHVPHYSPFDGYDLCVGVIHPPSKPGATP